MKSLNSKIRLTLGLFSLLLPSAVLASTISIDGIQINNIPGGAGQILSVFYVSAREPAISTSSKSLKVKAIRPPVQSVLVDRRNTATIPKVSIDQTNFEGINYIVFVVHRTDQDKVFLTNPDGTHPPDPRVLDNDWSGVPDSLFDYNRIFYVSLSKLSQVKTLQKNPSIITLDFGKDF